MSIGRAVARGLDAKHPSYELRELFLEFLEEEEMDDEILEGDIEDDEGDICSFLVENTDLDRAKASESLVYIYENRHLFATPEPPQTNQQQSDTIHIEETDDESDECNAEQYEQSPDNAEPHHQNASIHAELQQQSEAEVEQKSPEPPSPFTPYLFDLTQHDLKQKKEEVIQLLNEHCPYIMNKEHHSEHLIFVMMMCCITKKPFTSWIMDSFDRFKIEYCLHHNVDCSKVDPLYFSQFCPNFGQYLTELEDQNDLDFNSTIPNAMHEYNKHILHGMDFKPKYKICDDYYEYVTNIYGVNRVIQKLICFNPNHQDIDDENDDDSEDAIYPFQVDIWIIPPKLKKCGNPEDNDGDNDEEKKWDDIEEALLECDVDEEYYENEDMDFSDDDDIDDECDGIFEEDKHAKMVNWIERTFKKGIEIEKNNRYVLIVDRTKKPDEKSAYCLLHVHEDSINEDIAGYFDEPFFERSKRFAFVNESDPEHPWSLYEDHRQIFCVSYHVLSRKSVKMYWNVGDRKTRFKMSDLWNVWPMYFDESCYDESFIDDIKELPDNHDLPDQEFEDFYQCIIKSKKIDIDHLKQTILKTEMIQQKQVNVMKDDQEEKGVDIEQKRELQHVEDRHKITDIPSNALAMNSSSRNQDIDDEEEDDEEDEDDDEDEEEESVSEQLENVHKTQQFLNNSHSENEEHEEDEEDEHEENDVDNKEPSIASSQTSTIAYNSSVQQSDSSQSFNVHHKNNTRLQPHAYIRHDDSFDDEDDDHEDEDQDGSDKKYQNDNQYEDQEQSKMTKMMQWLKQKPLNTEYVSHYNAFENAVKEGFDDDSDFDIDNVLDELNYITEGEVDESELLMAMKEAKDCEQGFDHYITKLIKILKEYMGCKSSASLAMDVPSKNDRDENYNDTNYAHHHDEIVDVSVEYGGGGDTKENTKEFYKVYDKHFLYYCCGDCGGNHFARYLFNDITDQQKIQILSDYFWTFDYELRQNLIRLLTENYDLKQSQAFNDLLSSLNQPNVFIDDDEKWIGIFDKVLNENNGDILLKLSQLSCRKGHNFPLIKELRDNNTTFSNQRENIQKLQTGINEIRKNSIKFNINLTNDEMSVLYLIANDAEFNILSSIQNQDQFPNKQRSCKWKSFHLNLMSAINKLKKHRYRFKIPDNLFCFAQNINDSNDLNLYMNQTTLWHSKQLQQSNKNTILHLKDLRQQQNLQNNIQIIPIEWILNNNNDNNLFLVLPLRIHQISAVSTHFNSSQSIRRYTIPFTANYRSIDIITL